MNGNSSRPNSRTAAQLGSTRNSRNSFTVARGELDFRRADHVDDPGSIRAALVDAIRASGRSRAEIADEMTLLAGRKVTERMLNGYTAESQEDYLFPAELTRAFCIATNDIRLLTCMAELLQRRVIDEDEVELLDLGRAYLQRQQADEEMAKLQRRLHGRSL